VTEAKANNGAKLIVVDPALHALGRGGRRLCADSGRAPTIAFLSGVMRYLLGQRQRSTQEYVKAFTNASYIVKDGYKLPGRACFTGYDEARQDLHRPRSSWDYELDDPGHGQGRRGRLQKEPALARSIS